MVNIIIMGLKFTKKMRVHLRMLRMVVPCQILYLVLHSQVFLTMVII